jgi:hypothetical protein
MARRNPQRVGFPSYKLHAPRLTHVFLKLHELYLTLVPLFPRNLGKHVIQNQIQELDGAQKGLKINILIMASKHKFV